MKIIKTNFKDLLIVKVKKNFDKRGCLYEIFKENILKKKVFDYISISKKNTLRGLHFQINKQQAKLIFCIKGAVIDVCLDLRKNSKTFGKFYKILLSEKNSKGIYIPEGFAHGFYSKSNENILIYKNSNYRSKKLEKCIKWNDPSIKIPWPKKKFIMSRKDKKGMTFNEFKNKIKYL